MHHLREFSLRLDQCDRCAAARRRILGREQVNDSSTHHNTSRSVYRVLNNEAIVILQAELHGLFSIAVSLNCIKRIVEDRSISRVAILLIRVERQRAGGYE